MFSFSILYTAALIGSLTVAATASISNSDSRRSHHNASSHIVYTTITGFFQQDEAATDPSTFDFKSTNFGLLNGTYPSDNTYDPHGQTTQWQRFARYVTQLNKDAPKKVHYKILFMGRHGDGYHNDAQAFYGTPAWNCYYSEADGNATVTWSDAHLSPLGVTQALAVNEFWKQEITQQRIPTPQSFYTSPLTRCLQTANYTFSGLDLPHAFVPTVKELFREGISGHTCDRRQSRSYIHGAFPGYRFEKGFVEEDPLWQALHGETSVDQNLRSKLVLDDVFSHDDSTYISITSHSGEIASLLNVLGHRPFSLSTGAVIPVLVKAETLQGAPLETSAQAFTALCTCTSPPAVSATTSECSYPTDAGETPVYSAV